MTKRKALIMAIALSLVLFLSMTAGAFFGEEKKEKKEITVLMQGADPITEAAKKTADKFKEKTGYEVNIVTAPYSGIFDKLRAEMAAPTGSYDVALVDQVWISALSRGLVPLNDVVTSNMKQDYFQGLLSSGSYKDNIYGAPAWTNAKILLYRKDLFNDPQNKAQFKKEYGYELTPPATWKEYRDVAKFFTRDKNGDGVTDLYGTVLYGAGAESVTTWLNASLQAGADELVVDNNKNVSLTKNPKPYVESLDFLNSVLNEDKSVPSGALEMTVPNAASMFKNGKLAMMPTWAHFYIATNDPSQSKVGGKVGVTSAISGKGGIGSVPGPWYHVVLKSSEHKEIAKQYLKFMYEHNSVYLDTLGVAARKSAFKKYEGREKFAHLKPLNKTLSSSQTQTRPLIKEWEQISNEALMPAVQHVLEQNPSYQEIKEIVEKAADKTKNILD